ncbi:MAG: FHA domain-containing protein, partial [Gemmatimonadales bacterium]
SQGHACARCGTPAPPKARFCAACGTQLGDAAGPSTVAKQRSGQYQLAELDEAGKVLRKHDLYTPDTTIGREDADVRFPDDPYLSPIHVKLSFEKDQLLIRDLGSRNGTWVFLEEPYRLQDGDLILVGSQVIRFRRLGYPGPFTPDADATRRMGSLIPSADIASLTQLRSDGSARDVTHLSPGRDVTIGREAGDWVFSYDPSMSGAHATIRSEDADFVVIDRGSRNGVAIAARGEMVIKKGSRVLVGDKLLRVDLQ